MAAPTRIPAAEARRKVQAGEALLVCAYPNDALFRNAALPGAIAYSEFEKRAPTLAKDREIVFY